MFRQDNSKMLMKDPATASARIYVGNLSDNVVSMDIETHFSKYGKILGVLIHRGFGFIQFETEENANAAITNEHQNTFNGRNLVVRRAQSNSAYTGNGPNVQNNSMRVGAPDTPHVNRMASSEAGRGRGHGIDIGRTAHLGIGPAGRGGRGMNIERDRSPLDNRGAYEVEPTNSGNSSAVKEADDRNDCEIIVVGKALTQYAEYIEDKLKQLGISVDLLFPNEDVPVGRVLANIASRGCLYAVLVVPEHQENKSITLNILHGVQQEHRNMPLADAMTLIKNDFESYCHGDKQPLPDAIQNYPHIPFAKDKHPDSIQTLVNILAENRTLTALQYDKLMRYLQDRKEEQVKIELGDTDVILMESSQTKTQQELQQRILNILNKPIEFNLKKSIPEVPLTPVWSSPPPSKTSSTPLLHDPTVQKALDSLMQGNLLQNITGAKRF